MHLPAHDRSSTPASPLMVQVFSSLGHGYMHMLAVYYYLVVLPLERAWSMPYADLMRLWTAGAAMVGAMALPAGWLADRWSARGMMAVFFLGLGASAIGCGLATGPSGLWLGLTALGAFAAIYHPVGLPWLVTHAQHRGRALGVNGIFGSLGVASAGVVAGALIDAFGWRVAFVVPGVVSLATGAVMVLLIRRGRIPGHAGHTAHAGPAAHSKTPPSIWVLAGTMVGGALIYQATQATLPKLFSTRLASLVGDRALGLGAIVGVVYGVASLSQVLAGQLADRYPLKRVYVATIAAQVPLLLAAAWAGGWVLVALAVLMVVTNTGTLPAENLLLAEATPRHRQGVAFGTRFVLIFGCAPAAIWFVSAVTRTGAGFEPVFYALAALALATAVLALRLPGSARLRTTGDVR